MPGINWYNSEDPRWLHHRQNSATRRNVMYTLHHNPATGKTWMVRHASMGRAYAVLSDNYSTARKQWNSYLASGQ